MLSSSLEIINGNIIVDSYNNKDILTVLGSDGILYNLKSEIQTPSSFKNKNIKAISNNISSSTNLLAILYEDNEILVFNYKTGSTIYSTKNTDINVIDYFLKNISLSTTELLYDNLETSYENSEEFIDELEEHSLESYVNNTDESDNKYISVYDPVKQIHEVYEVNSLLSGTLNTLINQTRVEESINDIVNANYSYQSFYSETLNVSKSNSSVASLIIFIVILVMIFISMFILIILYNYLNSKNETKSVED